MKVKHLPLKTCICGAIFKPRYHWQEFCPLCNTEIEHDANIEMFGADANYLEHAGLADKIGNK